MVMPGCRIVIDCEEVLHNFKKLWSNFIFLAQPLLIEDDIVKLKEYAS